VNSPAKGDREEFVVGLSTNGSAAVAVKTPLKTRMASEIIGIIFFMAVKLVSKKPYGLPPQIYRPAAPSVASHRIRDLVVALSSMLFETVKK
jgi:hypothetical protein